MHGIATGRTGPRDLQQVATTLANMPKLKARLTDRSAARLSFVEAHLHLCPELRSQLESGLADECPLSASDGNFIREGFDTELDELRKLARGGKQWIASYQQQQMNETGIPNLKVGYNKVFGYYLEVTNAHKDKVPDFFIRKQTLKNCERYITPELKEYEEKVLAADDKASAREQEIFAQLRGETHRHLSTLQEVGTAIAELDVLASLAEIAGHRGWIRPDIVDDSVLRIDAGRHPVLDVTMPQGEFVPNDCVHSPESGMILLITGPNMAGKSTYIRQVALITLLAQAGSFVPAESARIGITDRIFARVGASDELSRGQSTFMVEMVETARILNTATSRSLVILDEIGRGTSTYDGLSLAWAITEHLHEQIGCRTLFATHYHELTQLEESLPRIANLNVAVKEWNDEVVFLHRIVAGGADKSYGIHVARLAGIPTQVNERAKDVLAQLEADHRDALDRPTIQTPGTDCGGGQYQLTLFGFCRPPPARTGSKTGRQCHDADRSAAILAGRTGEPEVVETLLICHGRGQNKACRLHDSVGSSRYEYARSSSCNCGMADRKSEMWGSACSSVPAFPSASNFCVISTIESTPKMAKEPLSVCAARCIVFASRLRFDVTISSISSTDCFAKIPANSRMRNRRPESLSARHPIGQVDSVLEPFFDLLSRPPVELPPRP